MVVLPQQVISEDNSLPELPVNGPFGLSECSIGIFFCYAFNYNLELANVSRHFGILVLGAFIDVVAPKYLIKVVVVANVGLNLLKGLPGCVVLKEILLCYQTIQVIILLKGIANSIAEQQPSLKHLQTGFIGNNLLLLSIVSIDVLKDEILDIVPRHSH